MITTLTKNEMGKFLLEAVRNKRKCPSCKTHNNVSSQFSLYCFDCEVQTVRDACLRDLPEKEVSNK